MDSSLHLVPGRFKLPTAPGGSWRKDVPGWEKAENKFTATSGLPACVCVCVLCRLHICTCVFQCVVCANKNLTKVLIIINSGTVASGAGVGGGGGVCGAGVGGGGVVCGGVWRWCSGVWRWRSGE